MPGWAKIGCVAVAVGLLTWLLWPGASEPVAFEGPGRGVKTPGERAEPTPAEPIGRVAAPLTGPADKPEPEAPRPGTIAGRVSDAYGVPLVGVRVSLWSDEGMVDEGTVDAEGRYTLVDDTLSANRLEAAYEDRELAPLMAGENRTLDLVLGETREIVGWVLDMAGDPLAGVQVTLRQEQGGLSWTAYTDGGGGFTFDYAPATVVRVTADGGELGTSSARLARTSEARREVTLVLEPSATIVVYAKPALGRDVVVQTYDALAHGVDPLSSDDLRPVPEVEYPREEQMMALLEASLKKFDANRPEASLHELARSMLTFDPKIEAELRRDAVQLDANLVNAPLDMIVGAAVKKIMRDEPQVVQMMSAASNAVKQGRSIQEALMEAAANVDGSRPPDVEPAVVEEPALEPAMPEEGEGELGEGEGELSEELGGMSAHELEPEDPMLVAAPVEGTTPEMVYEPAVSPDEYVDPLERWRTDLGLTAIGYPGDDRAIVARGVTNQEIVVRGGFRYNVSIRHPEGFEIGCGEVLAHPGQTVEVYCGQDLEAVVKGRIVDTEGQAASGLEAKVWLDGEEITTVSDESGRFTLRRPLDSAVTFGIDVHDPRGIFVDARRTNVTFTPGATFDLGTIVVRRSDEVPIIYTDTPFGGVGASLSETPTGIVIDSVGDDSPLALEGVEAGAQVLAVDEEDALMLPLEDMVVLLRGDIGSEVNLRLRSADGELYDVLVTRGLIDPQRGQSEPTPEGDLPLEAIGPE